MSTMGPSCCGRRWLPAVAVVIPLGLDLYMPVPDDNPLRADQIALGRQFDQCLSRDESRAGASCYYPARAFSDSLDLSYPRANRTRVSDLAAWP